MVAVGTDKGLVVPVLKNADELSFADIEKNIKDMSESKRGKLTIEDLKEGLLQSVMEAFMALCFLHLY